MYSVNIQINIADIFGKYSKLVIFGQQLQNISDNLKITLHTCENIWRDLAEFELGAVQK